MEDLSAIALFQDLPADASRRYAAACTWREFNENELVIDIEDETTDVRFVLSGHVRIISRMATGKEVILGEMGAGSYFGEFAAIDNAPRSANVTTLVRSRLCTMPSATFLQILGEHPGVAIKVMRQFSFLVRQLNLRLAEHSFLSAKHRLYNELIRLSRPRSGHENQRIISPPPTQREIAERIGSRREVVSRELNALKREGLIEVARGGIVIAGVGELQRRVSEGWEG